MTPGMEGYVNRWLFDPMVGKLVAITIGILIVIALALASATFHLVETPEINVKLVGS